MIRCFFASVLGLATWCPGQGNDSVQEKDDQRAVIFVPVPKAAGWQDDAFLCAVPAAVVACGKPLVLAVDPAKPWRPELVDFLKRLKPTRTWWLGGALPDAGSGLAAALGPDAAPGVAEMVRLPCQSAVEAACVLAAAHWPQATRMVGYEPTDRSAALAAAALAGRLGEPLMPCPLGGFSTKARESMAALGVQEVLLVGGEARRVDGFSTTHLPDGERVVRWLSQNGLAVEYLAVTNPLDVAKGPAPKLSIASVLLAVGRQGALAPLPYDTVWKQAYATEAVKEPPRGALESSAPLRSGTLEQGAIGFLTGRDQKGRRWWAQVDRNGDGDFADPGEQKAVRTGDPLELGSRRYTVNLDADEKTRGQSMWLTWPTVEEVRGDLEGFHRACNREVTALCLVGWPDTLPMAIVDHGQNIDADLVSDLPYGQTDDDPFVELAVGRLVAHDLASATLIACRGFAYELIPDRSWAHRFATAEWEKVSTAPLQLAGMEHVGHHPGEKVIGEGSPLTEVGLLVHASHASWTTMGKTYAWDAKALLAPCIVTSAGCSTASLDQDGGPHRSVASQMLRNGAVAFVGNTRRGIAQQALFDSEFMNAVLAGKSVGQANRDAINRVTVAVLEKGQEAGGAYYYQLYNHTLYGDPSWTPTLLRSDSDESMANGAARVEVRGQIATVHGPSQYLRYAAVPNPEWKCIHPTVFEWRGAGMGIESRWHPQDKRNADELFFTSEVRTRRRFSTIEPVDEPPEGIGWTGKVFVDKHADGSRSIFWRVRLIDYDMTTGDVRSQVEKLRFRLRTR